MGDTGQNITTSTDGTSGRGRAWSWIPTLYFAEGLPYILVMSVSVVMYKNLDVSNADLALYTSWLYLPWVIKPIWSPIIDSIRTKRIWILATQFLIGAGLAGVALMIPADAFFRWTLVFFWLVAFSSATHDISADGFYMLGLGESDQAFFVGIRSTFYRIAVIAGQGGLVFLAGMLAERTGSFELAWATAFYVAAGAMLLVFLYHIRSLPRPAADDSRSVSSVAQLGREVTDTFVSFFRKEGIGPAILFLLLYRFSEGQLAKMAAPFLLDAPADGGLGLTTAEVGLVTGTVGVLGLVAGGILGGMAVSAKGLRYWLWPMVLAINVPNVVYVLLAFAQDPGFIWVTVAVAVEQFGYGFGFTAFMMYMIYVADGPRKTSHFAVCTGIMALGMMLPGMISGALQDILGYQLFFVWIVAATIPSFLAARFIRIDPSFGTSDVS